MPYDSRQVSKGGNSGIDEEFSKHAPKGMFRVIIVDTFDGSDYVEGDYDTLLFAAGVATKNGGEMTMVHVYNDNGQHMMEAGSFWKRRIIFKIKVFNISWFFDLINYLDL